MEVAQVLVDALMVYGLSGTVFAIAFVTMGIQRVDSLAAHAPWGFRLIVLPGAAALWPLMLVRWLRAAPGSERR